MAHGEEVESERTRVIGRMMGREWVGQLTSSGGSCLFVELIRALMLLALLRLHIAVSCVTVLLVSCHAHF